MRGHLLLYRKTLAKRLNSDGNLHPAQIDLVARTIARERPPA